MADSSKHITTDDLRPTALPDAFLNSDVAHAAMRFEMPSYDDLPAVELYRDQVISFIDHVLEPLAACADGPWLTPSMVNNYVKQRWSPLRSRSSTVANRLRACSSSASSSSFFPWMPSSGCLSFKHDVPREVAYNYVAKELNFAIEDNFMMVDGRRHVDTAHKTTRESLLVRSATEAFAAKAFLMSYLEFAGYESL